MEKIPDEPYDVLNEPAMTEARQCILDYLKINMNDPCALPPNFRDAEKLLIKNSTYENISVRLGQGEYAEKHGDYYFFINGIMRTSTEEGVIRIASALEPHTLRSYKVRLPDEDRDVILDELKEREKISMCRFLYADRKAALERETTQANRISAGKLLRLQGQLDRLTHYYNDALQRILTY